ncbi:translational GTPase TypA [Kyrpidia spormannii]|uniref:Large ribosomal subunit assembly factor BipA n=1 Tax=Kyrpidia spormannii TaxID=2055160 RepID=A0A2K8N5Y2_9BACL|nr:translational GTPase TypA [Kyrpidia spormannii]ATY84713.1 translational GTPase TypA [Kyrpidia spormannii]
MTEQRHLRNVAIVAHVDHGKTTLVDQMLRQSGSFREGARVEERVMDQGELERERGITILAKNTSIRYGEYVINIVDTPGHADFSGEVERIIRMVDGVLLVVDAFEGVMPQTKFVLRKALAAGLAPIVVLNKMDRPQARPEEVLEQVYDLFLTLEASDEQLDFPVLYASAVQGTATLDPAVPGKDLGPLFEAIIHRIPAPGGDPSGPLQFQVTRLDYDEYLGRIGVGRIYRGTLTSGQRLALVSPGTEPRSVRVQKLYGFVGLSRVELENAGTGDLVGVAGIPDITVGETLADPDQPEPLPAIEVEEPTIEMTFLINDSPFAGREGTFVTSRQLRERLYRETERDVSLRVEDTDSPDAWRVAGRGELHLSILIETMRREGYELQVSRPRVILKERDGRVYEPYEWLTVDVPEEFVGVVMEQIGARKGELQNMEPTGQGTSRLEFIVPTRGLIGYRSRFLTETRGNGVMHHRFYDYRPREEGLPGRSQGVLIAAVEGTATAYGIESVQDRGVMFIEPGVEVYEGMIVGEHSREQDITVNVCKAKHVTNMRASTKEEGIRLKTPRKMSLEAALEYLADDEYCEITPKAVRLRKRILSKSERERANRGKAGART